MFGLGGGDTDPASPIQQFCCSQFEIKWIKAPKDYDLCCVSQ